MSVTVSHFLSNKLLYMVVLREWELRDTSRPTSNSLSLLLDFRRTNKLAGENKDNMIQAAVERLCAEREECEQIQDVSLR